MKNFLKSLVVVLAMAAPVAAFAETTIYYDNSASGWDEVHIHYWSDPGTSWPGVMRWPLTQVPLAELLSTRYSRPPRHRK